MSVLQKRLLDTVEFYYVSPIFFTEKKLERFDQFSTLKNYFENHNFEMIEDV